MNVKTKKITILILFIVLCLAGCNSDTSDKKTVVTESGIPETSMIYVYHPSGYKVVVEDERYKLKQPDSTSASIEEIMSVIAPFYEDNISYITYMLDSDNVITLEFNKVNDCSEEYYLLAKAGITRTLYQLSDISNIRIIIYSDDDEIVLDEELDRDAVYYYDEDIG